MSRSRVTEARSGLEAKGWIAVERANFIRPMFGFEVVENSTFVENSTNDVENSTENVENSTNPIYKDDQTYYQPNNQTNEPRLSDAFPNEEMTIKLEETFLWLRQKKNLRRLPEKDWVDLFVDLEREDILLSGFRDFYHWVESLTWINGAITIALLRSQIEAYKNRDDIEAKNKSKMYPAKMIRMAK